MMLLGRINTQLMLDLPYNNFTGINCNILYYIMFLERETGKWVQTILTK